MTWAMLDAGVDVDDPQAVAAAIDAVSIISGPVGRTNLALKPPRPAASVTLSVPLMFQQR